MLFNWTEWDQNCYNTTIMIKLRQRHQVNTGTIEQPWELPVTLMEHSQSIKSLIFDELSENGMHL